MGHYNYDDFSWGSVIKHLSKNHIKHQPLNNDIEGTGLGSEAPVEMNRRTLDIPNLLYAANPELRIVVPNNSCERFGILKGSDIIIRLQKDFNEGDLLFLTNKETQFTIASYHNPKAGNPWLIENTLDTQVHYPIDDRLTLIGKILDIIPARNKELQLTMKTLRQQDPMKLIQTNFEDNHSYVQVSGGTPNITINIGTDGSAQVKTEQPVEEAQVVAPADMVDKLKNYFYGNRDDAQSFYDSIQGMKNTQITSLVIKYLKENKLSEMSAHRDLWQMLHDNGYYSATESNWNRAIK